LTWEKGFAVPAKIFKKNFSVHKLLSYTPQSR
jgi:hypothetical protein